MVERAQRSLPSGIPLEDYARFYRLGKTKFHNYLQYDTFTGSDMRVLLYLPPNPEEEEPSRRLGHYYELGNLQTLTVSTHRPQPAVRTLGRANPKAFGRSVRTTAGTMIFNRVDRDAFTDAWGKCELERPDLVPFFLDQVPPFHLIIHAQNEMGLQASAAFIHVTLTDFGTAFTIEDLTPEVTYSYKCLYFRPFMDRDNWKHRLEETISKFEKFEGRTASGLAPLEDLDASIISDEFATDYKNTYTGGGDREGLN